MEFFYNMNGKHIGALRVYMSPLWAEKDPLNINVLWEKKGHQGNQDQWKKARVTIPRNIIAPWVRMYFTAFES